MRSEPADQANAIGVGFATLLHRMAAKAAQGTKRRMHAESGGLVTTSDIVGEFNPAVRTPPNDVR